MVSGKGFITINHNAGNEVLRATVNIYAGIYD